MNVMYKHEMYGGYKLSIRGVVIIELKRKKEYWVTVKETVKHQWYKQFKRMNKRFTTGRRCRGDVGVIV
ncbi:hypothetical protein [Paenibacillus alvei]|uniref:Uncharacterized protein n=1 Tax=Paenibacillus alvei TaxID=44250 RepID=A0A383RLH2_PAEAL|nr:hypothetical protein [Paenibacillus alvei]SYX85941.1 conserved protein of unknown function [Paenibacillus alvei]SYX87693.1 conserved protein of unknown function [Paenibacillus alvei]